MPDWVPREEAMDGERIRLLQSMAIFGGVGDETLARVLECAAEVRVARESYFFRCGSEGATTFVLEAGRVSVRRGAGDGELVLRELGPGDCFGEVALLDFGPRSASIRAEEDCEALEFGASDLLPLAATRPADFALIYMNLARELARRLRAADDRLFDARARGATVADGYAFPAF